MRSPLETWAFTFPLFLSIPNIVLAIPNCPYPGAVFPAPTNLAASPTIQAAIADLTTTFEARDTDPARNPNSTSWAIQVFSRSADAPIWEHYHTAPNLAEAGPDAPGVRTVDGDAVFRLGSLTKIFTIVAFLAAAGDEYWNSPITQFVPELEFLAGKAQYDAVRNVAWEEITLGELASHMAGIVRDYALEGELTQENNQTVLLAQGFPPAPSNMTPPCGEFVPCSRAQTFAGLADIPPSFAPSQTAGYSNLGYQFLAYALEVITGRNFTEMLEADVIGKLGLDRTFYTKPPDELGVIVPGGVDGWAYDLGEAKPTGNMYASASDLSSLGRSIFRHTLLSPSLTRRWLKPASLTASPSEALSYPWGVRRIALGPSRVVDAYGKAGSINKYSSLLVLLPDYDVGLVVLLAGDWPGNENWDVADAIGATLVPALEAAAREQADAMYAGTYVAAEDGLDSSLTLATSPGRPGLGVASWVSNGTDMLPVAVRYTLNYNVTAPDVRLYPTGLETALDPAEGGGGSTTAIRRKVAFKAVVENLDAPDHGGSMFSTNCGTWVGQTTAVYANMPLDQFAFTIDDSSADGGGSVVTSVEPLALRVSLVKSAASPAVR